MRSPVSCCRLPVSCLLFVLSACSAAPRRPAVPPPASEPAPPVDRDQARADIEVLTRDSYRLLSSGYENVYLDGLAHDSRLILIDVGPDELQVGFRDGAAGARRLFPDDIEYELWSKRLTVVVAADGSCAWTHDDLGYRVPRGARRATVPLRATALFEHRDGRWTKVLEHISYGQTFADAAERATPIDVAFTDETAGDAAGARAREVITSTLTAAGFSGDPDALAVGVAPEQEARGPAVAATPGVTGLTGATAAEAIALRVEVGRGGTVAWAAGLLRLHAGERAFTVRASWVLEQRQGDWRVVQLHVSAPASVETLTAEVFGTP